MDTTRYGSWAKAQLWRQHIKKNYRIFFWPVVLLLILLVWGGIQLNQNGHRMYNLWIGLGLGLVMVYHLFKPTILEALTAIGLAKTLTDGYREALSKEIGAALGFVGGYARLVGYLFLVVQTVFMMLAIHRFEDSGQAYIAAVATLAFTLIFWVADIKGHRFIVFLFIFWGGLMIVSMGLALFVPNYFKDDISYTMRHAQGKVEDAKRKARAAPIQAKIEAGQPLTLAERREKQYLDDQEKAVERLLPTDATITLKVTDGLVEQDFALPITPGRYTCRAELTARDPQDLRVTINGGGVDLATTAYINGQACNGKAEISFGPDGQAILHFNLDDDARAQVRGATRWIKLNFTPA